MNADHLKARLGNREHALRQDIAAARRALDMMEHELDFNPAYPNVSGSRVWFSNLIARAAEFEAIAQIEYELAAEILKDPA